MLHCDSAKPDDYSPDFFLEQVVLPVPPALIGAHLE